MIPDAALQKLRSQVELFNGFTDAEMIALLRRCQREERDPDDIVFREGGPSSAMYVILSGRVRISRSLGLDQEEELATLESGDCFGEMGLIDIVPRSARATTSEPSVLLTLHRGALAGIDAALTTKLFRNFVSILAGRLRGANEHIGRLIGASRELAVRNEKLTEKVESLTAKLAGKEALRGADLTGADLGRAKLTGADLRGAVLKGARLRDVDLQAVDLRGADFREAWFVDTNLTRADLTGADLRGAVFRGCNLHEAHLTGAHTGAIEVLDELGERPVGSDEG